MRQYFKILIIGWSIACIGLFIILFRVTKDEFQKNEHYITLLKQPSKLTGNDEDIRTRKLWEELERRESFKEFVAYAKAKADTAESVKYIEYSRIENDFYVLFPLLSFAVWSIPIIVFSLLGLLFKPK